MDVASQVGKQVRQAAVGQLRPHRAQALGGVDVGEGDEVARYEASLNEPGALEGAGIGLRHGHAAHVIAVRTPKS
jgi:hypothetical protein